MNQPAKETNPEGHRPRRAHAGNKQHRGRNPSESRDAKLWKCERQQNTATERNQEAGSKCCNDGNVVQRAGE